MKLGKFFQISPVVLMIIACTDSNETRMQRFLVQGNEKVREQDYVQAEKYFNSALKIDSCFADALNNLGTLEHTRRNYQRSVDYYSKAIQCNDTFYLAYFNRANAYFENNMPARALDDVAVIEKIYSDSVPLLELKGLVYWKLGELVMATTIFRKILVQKSEDVNALINLGTLYTSMRNRDSAQVFLGRALSLKENDDRALNAMAMLQASGGDTKSAMQYIGRALSAKPGNAYYLNNKGYVLLLLKKYEEALKFINESITADPYNGWAYRNKGIYYFSSGQFADALRLLRQAETIDPAIDDLYLWLARTLLETGDKDAACDYFRKAVKRGQILKKELPSPCQSGTF
jgi:tetratricopeptide (TPR) repeat protein